MCRAEGRLVTREVFKENGNHPVFNGEFDVAALCDA